MWSQAFSIGCAPNVAEEWEAGVKSSSARAYVRGTGVNFGSESFQLDTDRIWTDRVEALLPTCVGIQKTTEIL